jgi:TRAP-type mannitol/chloroaromatic compound transport system permease small subunit
VGADLYFKGVDGMSILKIFVRYTDRITSWIGLASSALMPLMVFVIAFEVVSRYFFDHPTIWAYDMAIFFFCYCGLLSGAYVLRLNEHINVDILYSRLSPRGKAVLDSITYLFLFFFIILVIIYSWKYAILALSIGERTNSEWGPPAGHYKLMIPIGGFLIFAQALSNWTKNLYRAFTGKELES